MENAKMALVQYFTNVFLEYMMVGVFIYTKNIFDGIQVVKSWLIEWENANVLITNIVGKIFTIFKQGSTYHIIL